MEPYESHHDSLRKLLALKRHEVPPPGFFDRLPNRILVNIRAGSEIPDPAWWTRCWEMLLREPMVVSSYTALAMGALLFGVSVFQTAVETEEPANLVLQDPVTTYYDMAGHSTASLPHGVIYRTGAPRGGTWIRTDPFVSSNPPRIYGLAWEADAVPSVSTETVLLRGSR